jgi:hypothetical protein
MTEHTLDALTFIHSGCLAWYIQKYLRWPFSERTVPIQLRGLMFSSLGSGKLNVRRHLYHSNPRSKAMWPNMSVLFLRTENTNISETTWAITVSQLNCKCANILNKYEQSQPETKKNWNIFPPHKITLKQDWLPFKISIHTYRVCLRKNSRIWRSVTQTKHGVTDSNTEWQNMSQFCHTKLCNTLCHC